MKNLLSHNPLVFRILSVKNTRERICLIRSFYCNDHHAVLLLQVYEASFVAVVPINTCIKHENDDIDEFFMFLQKGYHPQLDHTLVHYFSAQCIYARIHTIDEIGQVLFLVDSHAVCALYGYDDYMQSWKPLATLTLSDVASTSVTHFACSLPYLCWATASSVASHNCISKVHFATFRITEDHVVTCDVLLIHEVSSITALTTAKEGVWIQHIDGIDFFCVNTCRILRYSHFTESVVLQATQDNAFIYMHDNVLSCIAYQRDALFHVYTVPLECIGTLPISSFIVYQNYLVMLINNAVVIQYSLADLQTLSTLTPPQLPPRRDHGGFFYFEESIGYWNDTTIAMYSFTRCAPCGVPHPVTGVHISPLKRYAMPPLTPPLKAAELSENALPSYDQLQRNRYVWRDCEIEIKLETFEDILVDAFERHPLLYVEGEKHELPPVLFQVDPIDILDLTTSMNSVYPNDYLELLTLHVLCASPHRLEEFLRFVRKLHQQHQSTPILSPFTSLLQRVNIVCSMMCSHASASVCQQHAFVKLCIASGDFTLAVKFLLACDRSTDGNMLLDRLNAYAIKHNIPSSDAYTECILLSASLSSQSFMGHVHTIEHMCSEAFIKNSAVELKNDSGSSNS